jgi:ADP-heptose:LPS heptosyltransferase
MIPWRKSARTGDTGVKRVLIIQLGGLAEFVQALAPARAIREAHVGAHITLLATEATQALAEQCPHFDKVEADGAASHHRPDQAVARRPVRHGL